jgi:carbon-monoxide dehydrogenase medium subunit
MIPAKFKYVRPKTLTEALALLVQNGDSSAILAGGHSLLTELKQRRRNIALVVDIAFAGSATILLGNDGLSIGAMANQNDILTRTVDSQWHLLSEVAAMAADPMIRNRGTLVGALCALEPGGDWAPVALALDAQVSILDNNGEKSFLYSDLLENSVQFPKSRQIVTSVYFPTPPTGAFTGYRKFKHSSIGWSVASIAFSLASSHARIAVSGAAERPSRLKQLEQFLEINPAALGDFEVLKPVIEKSLESLEYRSDRYASAEYRKHRLRLMLQEIILAASKNIRI